MESPDKNMNLESKGNDLPISTNDDTNIVDWDGDGDLENPMNWSPKRRAAHVGLISFITLVM